MPRLMHRSMRLGGTPVIAVSAIAALTALTWTGIAALRPSRSAPLAKSSALHAAPLALRQSRLDPEPLDSQELAVTLTRLGLDAPSLAAAGLTGPQTSALVGRVRAYLGDHIQDLRDADSDWAAKRQEVDRLERLIRGGMATHDDKLAYAAAQTALSQSTSARQSVLAAIQSAAGEQVASGPLTTLATMQVNRASWDVPTRFLAGTHDEPGWVALRDALANDRISAAMGTDPDPTEHQLLLNAEADSAVAAANTNLNSNQALVVAAWNTAVFQ